MNPTFDNSFLPGVTPAPFSASDAPVRLEQLLGNLEEVVHSAANPQIQREIARQQQLVEQRLGLASSLFEALRAKHSPTAAHCLRVSLGCSSWAERLKLTEAERTELEIASLLHDIGKIGVPDKVLCKTGQLDADDQTSIEMSRAQTRNILMAMGTPAAILESVHYAAAWYDGRNREFDRSREQLPLASRLIRIVDAFDSMTTNHVYRQAKTRELALSELQAGSGTQFDPQLVEDFCQFMSIDQAPIHQSVSERWLHQLSPSTANSFWTHGSIPQAAFGGPEWLFHRRLLDSMQDGVIFLDANMTILLWNRTAEQLTGLPAATVIQRNWTPSLVEMTDERGRVVRDGDCPLRNAIESSTQVFRRLSIGNRFGESTSVDVQLVPIVDCQGPPQGLVMIIRDASRQVTLEERVQTLHEQATRDPLTQLANRSEFDRVQIQFVRRHLDSHFPCALIICDIDHFKQINDTYGHQAGDEALQTFSRLLQEHCRPGDLVARYGGEEFAILCADCNSASAVERAEAIRKILEGTPQPALNDNAMTASFGVTEVQGGDTPETMLRRADRALYQAKNAGRNRVVQIGGGLEAPVAKTRRRWFSWFSTTRAEHVLTRDLFTNVPMNVAAEKLRGFICDQNATIESISENRVVLMIEASDSLLQRRADDRLVPYLIEMDLREQMRETEGRHKAQALGTIVSVTIRPQKPRDRRRRDIVERARLLLISLKSYLMACELADAKS